jgi:hypothetical protein
VANTFADRYSDLVQWFSDTVAHTLAKKLTEKDVDQLLNELQRIKRETMVYHEQRLKERGWIEKR